MELLNYNAAALKKEITAAKKEKVKTETQLKKLHEKDSNGAALKRAQINNEKFKKMYRATRIPARLGDLVIDYTLLNSMLKKLKGYEFKLSVGSVYIKLDYWKPGTKSKGHLILDNVDHFYEGFRHIPTLEVDVECLI